MIFDLALLAIVSSLTLAQRPEQSPPLSAQLPEGAVVHPDLPYVTNGHERQKLDLYLPKDGTNLPLIIVYNINWLFLARPIYDT